MDKTQQHQEERDLGRMPKDFVTSWLLLLLRNANTYGYQLIQTLMVMGLGAVDPATVYRTLRQLEKEGLISSSWDPRASGPARRMYTLTETGEEYLRLWADHLERYQEVLSRFFDIYKTQQHDKEQT